MSDKRHENAKLPLDLSELDEFMGAASQADKELFIGQYLENLEVKFGDLKIAYKEQNYNNVYSISHTIKTTALYVAAHDLSNACQALEDIVKQTGEQEEQLTLAWQSVVDNFIIVITYLKNRGSSVHG